MIKENLAWTQDWHCRRQVLRSAALLPECGLEKNTFVVSLPEYCQITARKMIQNGALPIRNGRVMPPSPLLVQRLDLKEEYVIEFLGGLYVVLISALDEFQKKELSLKDKLCEIRRMRENIVEDNKNLAEHTLIQMVDSFLNQYRLPRIGSLDFAKDEINRYYNGISMIHYRQFGDARMNAIRDFYQSRGESICQTLKKAMEMVPLQPHVQENILECLIDFYNLAEMLAEPLEPALHLLQLYKERDAQNWEFAWIYMIISDAYMGCFATRDDWMAKSNEYLELSCEFSKKAYEDTEKETMEAQS